MIVKHFNTSEGLYEFQLDSLGTTLHSHPAVEVLFAEEGCFQLQTEQSFYENSSFAVIGENVKHKVVVEHALVRVLMLERRENAVCELMRDHNKTLVQGHFVFEKGLSTSIDYRSLSNKCYTLQQDTHYDDRVLAILDFLNNHQVSYDRMLDTLSEMVHLSESRLSHLFKLDVGVSLKKYLLWCRLRNTIAEHLGKGEDLFSSLIKSGFYDQPHFSRAFKDMLGIKPSGAYNSRTVQD